MSVVNVSAEDKAVRSCTGCQMCAAVCPVKAIKIDFDKDGFYTPTVDMTKCVNCGLCVKSCYKYDTEVTVSRQHVGAWACKAPQKEILERTTSGGIAYLLADNAVKSGYSVLGVAYDNITDRAVAQITDTDVEPFIGSKYIQAYTEEAFDSLLEICKHKEVVAFGLPCHIYALDKAAREKNLRDKLILIDLFCHGCPSMMLWDSNVKYIQDKMKADSFDAVLFRSKKKGWHEFCQYFKNKDKEYLSGGEASPFYQLFFSNQLLNDACSDCKLRGTLAYCDLRLGDFWGATYDCDREGVSAVVAATEKGKAFLHKLPDVVFIKDHELDEICKAQSFDIRYTVDKRIRQRLLELLRSGASVKAVEKQYIRMLPPKNKIKRFARKIFALAPQGMRYKIKKIAHSK